MTPERTTLTARTAAIDPRTDWALADSGPLEVHEVAAVLSRYKRSGCLVCRNRLVESHLRLLAHVARRHARRGRPFDDLMAEGAIALMRAIDSFDMGRGVPFAAYASITVDHALRGAADDSALIRVPRQARAASPGRGAGQSAGHGEMSPSPRAGGAHRSHAAPWGRPAPVRIAASGRDPDERHALVDAVADGRPSPDEMAEAADLRSAMERCLGELDPLVTRVLTLRFGLCGAPPQSISQIGRELRLSPCAVERCLSRGIQTLRSSLAPPVRRQGHRGSTQPTRCSRRRGTPASSMDASA